MKSRKKTLKILFGFELVRPGAYTSLKDENQVHQLIILLIQKEVLVEMYSLEKKASHTVL